MIIIILITYMILASLVPWASSGRTCCPPLELALATEVAVAPPELGEVGGGGGVSVMRHRFLAHVSTPPLLGSWPKRMAAPRERSGE